MITVTGIQYIIFSDLHSTVFSTVITNEKLSIQPFGMSMKILLRTLLILLSVSCLSAWYKKAHFKVDVIIRNNEIKSFI